MKIRWDKDMTTKVLAAIIVAFFAIMIYFIFLRFGDFASSLSWFFSIFKPFIWGLILAYFINFLIMFSEKRFLRKVKKPKTKRVWAMVISYIIFLVLIVLFLFMLIPQTLESLAILVGNLPTYIENLIDVGNALIDRYELSATVITWINEFYVYIEDQIAGLMTNTNVAEFLKGTYNVTTRVAGTILNLFIAVVVSIYFLAKKETYQAQIKKTMTAYLGKERTTGAVSFLDMTNRTFSNFLVGKILDSAIIGVICFIVMSIFNFPFTLLISVIIGVTNIIPFFGPFLGAIPSFFIILIADPSMALWFLLFILILQQIDGNIIGPKILGFSIGMSALWILFAIIIGGKLFGFIGMIIGVPAFAILFVLFKRYTEQRLEKQGLSTDTRDYAPKDNQIRF